MFIKKKDYYELLGRIGKLEHIDQFREHDISLMRQVIAKLQLPRVKMSDFTIVVVNGIKKLSDDHGSYEEWEEYCFIHARSKVDHGPKVVYGGVILKRCEIEKLNQEEFIYVNDDDSGYF